MAPHQKRVIEEKTELDNRLARLRVFLHNGGVPVPFEERQRLVRQVIAMQNYSDILAERIEAFEVIHAD